MIRLPRLPGTTLRDVMAKLGITQREVADAVGCSVPTLQRAVTKLTPIGEQFASRLAPHLIGIEDAALELGLSYEALRKAEKQDLRVDRTKVGELFWRPGLANWAAAHLDVVPASLESRARRLCVVLGMSEAQGMLRCGICEDNDVEPAGVAFRRCEKCGERLCMANACGIEFVPELHDGQRPLPVVCTKCRFNSRRTLTTAGAHGYLPGMDVADELNQELEKLVAEGASRSALRRLRERIEQFHRYYEQTHASVREYLAHQAAHPPGGPDLFAVLRHGERELRREATSLGQLLRRLDEHLSS